MRTKGMYSWEGAAAWLLALIAIGLGVIGALAAYNVFDLRTLQDVQNGGLNGGVGSRAQDFEDGVLLMLPAIVLAFLAFTLHATERYLAPGETHATKRWQMEHSASYLTALLTVWLAAAGIVVGYDVWDNGWAWTDGVVLELLALGAGMVTGMLHSVGHYTRSPIDDDIRVIVENRVSQTLQRAGTVISERAPEHR